MPRAVSRIVAQLFVFAALLQCIANLSTAQTLASVLRAVQERQVAVSQVSMLHEGGAATPVLINWTTARGASSAPSVPRMPGDNELDQLNLSFSQKIHLLQLASEHFSRLRPQFLNIDIDIAQSNPVAPSPAEWRPFGSDDLPDLPVVNQDNFLNLLPILARQVAKLRLLAWPANATAGGGPLLDRPVGPILNDTLLQILYFDKYIPSFGVPVVLPFRADIGPNYLIPFGDITYISRSDLFQSGAQRMPDVPYIPLAGYWHNLINGDELLTTARLVNHDLDTIDDSTSVGSVSVQNAYATGFRIRVKPSTPLVAGSPNMNWLNVAFTGWAADDWTPKVAMTGTWAGWRRANFQLLDSDGQETVVFGNVERPTEGDWPDAWQLSATLGLPGSSAQIQGQWIQSLNDEGETVSLYAYKFNPAYQDFAFERRLIVLGQPTFSDAALSLADTRWAEVGRGAGEIAVELTYPVLKIDLGRGVGTHALNGSLILDLVGPSAGFNGVRFAGCRADFQAEYEEPPPHIYPAITLDNFSSLPSSTQTSYNAAAQQAGMTDFITYLRTADQRRLKSVRGAQVVAELSRNGDYNCSVSLRYIVNGVPGSIVKTIVISNPTASSTSFPTDPDRLRIVELATVESAGRQWDLDTSIVPSSNPARTMHTLNLALPNGSPFEELKYEQQDLGGTLGSGYRRSLSRRSTAGGSQALAVVKDDWVQFYFNFLAKPPSGNFALRRQISYPVQGTLAQRDTFIERVIFPPLINANPADPYWSNYLPSLEQYVTDKITCTGNNWELDGALWDYDGSGRLISQQRAFNSSEDYASRYSTDPQNSYALVRKDSIVPKGSAAAGTLFRQHTRTFGSDMMTWVDSVVGSTGSAETVKTVVLSGPNPGSGRPTWRPLLTTHSDGSQTYFTYFSDAVDNSLRIMQFDGPNGLGSGVASVTRLNQQGFPDLYTVLACQGVTNLLSVPSGTTVWSMAATATNALGQPSSFIGADGSTTQVSTALSGSWAGMLKQITGCDRRVFNVARDGWGDPETVSELGGPSLSIADKMLSGSWTYAPLAGSSKSMTQSVDAFGNLLSFNNAFGTGTSFSRSGPESGSLQVDTTVGGNRSVGISWKSDGSEHTVAAGAGSRGAKFNHSMVSIGSLRHLKVTATPADPTGPEVASYFDHRSRIVRRDVSHPNGSGGTSTTYFDYPSNNRSVIITPPAGMGVFCN